MGDIRNACAGLANVVGQGGEKNERERERNGRRQREDERLRRTPGNSKFSLQRGIVISIQVFRMNYWPVRLSPWVDIFGTTSTPLSLSLSLPLSNVRCIPQEAALYLAYFIPHRWSFFLQHAFLQGTQQRKVGCWRSGRKGSTVLSFKIEDDGARWTIWTLFASCTFVRGLFRK